MANKIPKPVAPILNPFRDELKMQTTDEAQEWFDGLTPSQRIKVYEWTAKKENKPPLYWQGTEIDFAFLEMSVFDL